MKSPRSRLKHPRLVDVVCNMLRASGMTQAEMALRYQVSASFIETLLAGKHCPNADICQLIYEDLTGRALAIKMPRQRRKLTGRSKQACIALSPLNEQAEIKGNA